MARKKDKFERLIDASIGSGFALQSTPLLRASGRTPTALAGTAEGFVGLTFTGIVARGGLRAIKATETALIKKTRRRRR